MAGAGRQMAGAAGECRGAMGDDRRHRRMHVGEPVRRVRQIVDLFRRIGLRASRESFWLVVLFRRRRLNRIGNRECPIWPIRAASKNGRQTNEQSQKCFAHTFPNISR